MSPGSAPCWPYAFLVTYQAYYLLDKTGTAKAEVPQQIFLGALVQSGSFGVLYAVAGVSAIIGAVTILPVKRVR